MWWLLGCSSSFNVRPLPDLVQQGPHATVSNAWTFAVKLERPLPLNVRCTLTSDPEEWHERVLPEAASHEVTLFGLLADERYDCTLSAGRWREQRTIQTEPLPDWLPTWSLETSGELGSAYTLFSHGTDQQDERLPSLIIVDPEARARWAWRSPFEYATDLDAQYLGDGQILYGGGYQALPTVIDLEGQVLAAAGEPSTGGRYNHHVERLPDGEVITLVTSNNTDGQTTWEGFSIDRLDPSLQGLVSRWDSQRGVDEGWLPPGEEGEDTYHANALIPYEEEVWVNLYRMAAVVALDEEGEHKFTLGMDQDFALVDDQGAPADDSEWFRRCHAPERDGDRLLVYDNGDGERPWSRAAEYALDEEARTARLVWSFTEPDWYEPIWGDIDRLPDDRVLIVRAHCETCNPDTGQRMQILEVDRSTHAVVWRMSFHDPHSAGYRAARIDGCNLFTNRKYCP